MYKLFLRVTEIMITQENII